jgi:polysaccharide export outer membrane protein
LLLAMAAALAGAGCQALRPPPCEIDLPACADVPRELCKTVLPTYVIEPPDILLIDATHVVPRPPYQLRSLDLLRIRAEGALPDSPIAGFYPIDLGGTVNLGPPYGQVRVEGMTVEQAQAAVEQHLRQFLKQVSVVVALADIGAKQQIAGQHLVAPDGTVTLGTYGSVAVVGMTLADAKQAVERHLTQFLDHPEVSVDVFAYNSKVFYIITQGAGMGDGVRRFPVMGNETLLDAISHIYGLTRVSSTRIWIARPSPLNGKIQVLPVDWYGLTALGETATNYQIMPGDRIFVAQDRLIALDTGLAKLTAPLERIMGFSLLGVGTVTRFSGPVLKGGGSLNSSF